MFLFRVFRSSSTAIILLLCFLVPPCLQAQSLSHFEPSLESLDKHSLPQWYADAKLGIFIHWGLYSVPGWARSFTGHDLRRRTTSLTIPMRSGT
jgi:alpha-L-fucosidase